MLRMLLRGRTILPFMWGMFVLVASAPAWALTTGSLRVYTLDEDGLTLPGVSISLESENLMGAQERLTDGSGMAMFVELPPGIYQLLAQREGFTATEATEIHIDVGKEAKVTLNLHSGDGPTEVEVIGKKAIDTSNTTLGTVMDKDFLSHIPVGITYQAAVDTVTGSDGSGGLGGGASNENTYMLDGANITDPVTGTFSANFNFDAIAQIEVLLGGYMPEYGQSTGGIVNVVFESGTNNLAFDTGVYYYNGAWAPKIDARITADGQTLQPTDFDSPLQGYQVQSKVSGPIIRDKAWFFFSYRLARSLAASTGVPQQQDFEGHNVLMKLTVQPNTEHRISYLLQLDPTTIDNFVQGDPFVRAEAQSRQAQGGFLSSLKWQWFLSPELNVETLMLVQKIYLESGAVPCTHDRTRSWNQCRPTEAEGNVDWTTPGRYGFSGAYSAINSVFFNLDDRWRYTLSSKLSVLSQTDPLGGVHDIKVGAEAVQVVWDQVSGFNGDMYYLDMNSSAFDPSSYTNYAVVEASGPISFRTTSSTYDAFIQDSWKPVSNVTINYGSRIDNFTVRNDSGEPVLTGTLLGPRLFAAWDATGDQKTKIATGWGRFNSTGRLGVASFVGNGSFGTKQYAGEFFSVFGNDGIGHLTGFGTMLNYSPRENTNIAAENIRNPRVDEVILSIEREVVTDLALTSNMSGKMRRNLFEFDDVNAIYDGDGSAIIGTRNGDSLISRYRLRTPDLAKRDYFQWDLGFRKIFSARWTMNATYTFRQSFGSSSTSTSGSFSIDPLTQYNYGPLRSNTRHQLQTSGFWQLPTDPWTQTVGFFFRAKEGYPIERLYYYDNWGGNNGGYGMRIRDRGTYDRYNFIWNLDLQFSQEIPVRKGKLDLFAYLANITNNRTPEQHRSYPLAQQNRYQTSYRQGQTFAQVGVSYEF